MIPSKNDALKLLIESNVTKESTDYCWFLLVTASIVDLQ